MKILPAISLTVSLFYFACHNKAKRGEALTPCAAEHIIKIETGNTISDELVNFACSLAGDTFTGTDSTNRIVGHMGIISSTPGEPLRFMHSTLGRGYGVVETDFYTKYYEASYVKVIRVFPQNDPAPQKPITNRLKTLAL